MDSAPGARQTAPMSPRDPDPVTLSDVVRRAVEAADLGGDDPRLGRLLEEFEDDDEPISGVDQLDEVLAEAELDVDADGEDPQVALAIAVARYLAHHRGALDTEPDRLVREAVRWQWHRHPPEGVDDLLADRGIEL
jgi:hypothetical protein